MFRLVIGEVVGELDLDVGQTEQRDRPDRRHVRDAGHLDLNRNGHVAFHFLGRGTGVLDDDIDQRRHRIGVRLDVQFHESDGAGGENREQQKQHEIALPQRGDDESVHVRFPDSGGKDNRGFAFTLDANEEQAVSVDRRGHGKMAGP